MPHGLPPPPPHIIMCPNLPLALYLSHARVCVCAALNPHFMLVNYTGAAGDLPGEIPRKSDQGVLRYAPWNFGLGQKSCILSYPAAFGRSVQSPAGPVQLTHFEKQRSLLLVVLGGSVRGTRSPSLTSFLSRIPHARVSCENTGCTPKAPEKQTDCQTP